MKLQVVSLIGGTLLCAIALVAGPAMGAEGEGDNDGQQTWGGAHVRMEMTAQGATIEFDCAHGSILQPVQPNAAGEFTAAGSYTPERGGPVMKDNPPRDLPATYKGSISGDTMHLEVLLSDKTRQPPSFTLTRGAMGRVVKCR